MKYDTFNEVEVHSKIQQLRGKISDIIQSDARYDEDFYLYFWLMGRGMSVKRTEMEIRDSVEWRRANNVAALAGLTWNSEFINDIPCTYSICKTSGKPVLNICCDGVDVRPLIQKYGRQSSVIFVIEMYAKLEKVWFDNCKKIKNKFVKDNLNGECANTKLDLTLPQLSAVTVGSFNDFPLWNAKSLDVITLFIDGAKIGKKYFPCMSSAVYVTNLNKVSFTFFKLIKPIIYALPFTFDSFGCDKTQWAPQLLQVLDITSSNVISGSENNSSTSC